MEWLFIPYVVLAGILLGLTLISFLHYRYDRKRKKKREAVLVRHENTVRLVQRPFYNATKLNRGTILCVYKGNEIDDVIRECNELENNTSSKDNPKSSKTKAKWGKIRKIPFFSLKPKMPDSKITSVQVVNVKSLEDHIDNVTSDQKDSVVTFNGGRMSSLDEVTGDDMIRVST